MFKKSIEDVINSLSEEEKEKFKDLIHETLERDRIIRENTEKSLKALKALRAFSKQCHLVQPLEEGAAKLEKVKEDIRSIKYSVYLKSIPDNKFYQV